MTRDFPLQGQEPAQAPAETLTAFPYPVHLTDGQVRVRLPFHMDLARLTEVLRKERYPVANDPDDIDSQGWGADWDLENYYPYWVFQDSGVDNAWVFAYPPEDYRRTAAGHEPYIGPKALEEYKRWEQLLQRAAVQLH